MKIFDLYESFFKKLNTYIRKDRKKMKLTQVNVLRNFSMDSIYGGAKLKLKIGEKFMIPAPIVKNFREFTIIIAGYNFF